MKPDELRTWLAIGAAILSAGIWLGSLQNRVTQLEKKDTFIHGTYDLPKER